MTSFYCTACSCVQPIWFSQCPACGKWNTITRSPEQAAPPRVITGETVRTSTNGSNVGLVLDGSPVDIGVARDDDLEMPEPITSVSREDVDRFLTNIPALDHVLGGGLVPGGDVVIGGDPGAGKCLGRGTLVTMADGRAIAVEKIIVGDRLMGPDGKARVVLSLAHGEDELYRIDPIKGEPWVCNSRHIMTLVNSGTDEVFDMPLSHLLEANANFRHHAKLFSVGVDYFEFDRPDMRPIDPYFLGLWFGDGTKQLTPDGRLAKIQITKPDVEVRQECERIAAEYGLRVVCYDARGYTYSIVGERGEGNPLLDAMREALRDDPMLHVPLQYALAPRAERLAFLAGWLDSDGDLGHGCFSITQKREDWARVIHRIARSLGMLATIAMQRGRCRLADGSVFEGYYWRVMISGDTDEIPTRIVRKQAAARRQVKQATRTGFHVEPIGRGEYFGFTLDGDGRFLLGDFTVTHNSTMILQAMAACARWNEARVLYVTGEEDVAQVALRADRVQASYERVYLVAETDPDRILRMAERLDVEIIVVDSISTMCMPDLGAMPGSATQVRACAEILHVWCREHRVALVQIAHVTKDGAVAGPNTLRHLVDAVLFLEALEGSQLRTLRAHKNRYGSTAKLGRFEMTEAGLASVGNYTDEPQDTPQREPADADPALVQAKTMS